MKVGLYIELEPGWHTYWTNPGETGAAPTLEIQQAQDSPLHAPAPYRFSSSTAESFGYEHEVLFYRDIKLDNPETLSLDIQAEWLVCKEVCIPNTKTFSVPLLNTTNQDPAPHPIFQGPWAFPKSSPKIQAFVDSKTDQVLVENLPPAISADVFALNDMNFDWIQPLSTVLQDTSLRVTFASTPKDVDLSLIVTLLNQEGRVSEAFVVQPQEKPIPKPASLSTSTGPNPTPHNPLSLMTVLLFALLGGLILNLMPCVFPVISIKFFQAGRLDQKTLSARRRSSLYYCFGIIASFWVLALLLLIFRSFGENLGWGFQLQSPGMVLFMVFFFFLIGLNFLGFFSIDHLPLPELIKQSMNQKGHVGDFFTGVFTTVLATPCTAPFMAASIGYAMTQSPLIVLLTFTMLGLGLSLPYILLSMFPQLTSRLPKPGPWMKTMQELLALPMLLSSAWLIWVYLKLTSSSHLLYLLMGLACLPFVFQALRWTKKRWVPLGFMTLSLGLAVYPLTFDASISEIGWIPFTPQAVTRLHQDNQYVFVDFTADWCLTCKANEKLTFGNQNVLDAIADKNVQMVKADWTKKDPVITETLQKFDRIGVPFYLMYIPGQKEPIVMPTLLTPDIFMGTLEKDL